MKDVIEKFVENVKAGKVPGLTIDNQGAIPILRQDSGIEWEFVESIKDEELHPIDWVTATIRRALTRMGARWDLSAHSFEIDYVNLAGNIIAYDQGTELDWHIAAINYAVERGETK